MRYTHTCIRVKDLDKSIKFYDEVLGLEEVERLDYPEDKFTLVYLENPKFKGPQLELTYNYDHPGYDLGDGYAHMAFYTDDLKGQHQRIKEAGYEVGELGGLSGDPDPRFFFVTDPDGYLVEIINDKYTI